MFHPHGQWPALIVGAVPQSEWGASKLIKQFLASHCSISLCMLLLVSCTSIQMCPSYFHFKCTFLQLTLDGVKANVTGGSWPHNWKEHATYSVEVNNWCIDSWVGLVVKSFFHLHTWEIPEFEGRSTFESSYVSCWYIYHIWRLPKIEVLDFRI